MATVLGQVTSVKDLPSPLVFAFIGSSVFRSLSSANPRPTSLSFDAREFAEQMTLVCAVHICHIDQCECVRTLCA